MLTVHRMQSEIDSLQQENESLRDQMGEVDVLQRENETLRHQVGELQSKNRASKQSTMNSIQQFQQMEEENVELNQEISDLTEHCEALQEQLDSYSLRIKESHKEGTL